MGSVTSAFSRAVLSSDENSLYYSVLAPTSRLAVLWKFDISGTQSEWTEIPSSQEIYDLLVLDSTHLFICFRESAALSPVLSEIEWGNTTPVWAINRDCRGGSTCFTRWGASITSDNGDKIFSLLAQNFYRRVVFEIFNSTTGDTINSRFDQSVQPVSAGLDLRIIETTLWALFEYQSNVQLYSVDISDLSGTLNWETKYSLQTSQGSMLQNNNQEM